MRTFPVLAVGLMAAPAFAQLPAPSLVARVAPRAAWTAVVSAGFSTGATTGTPTPNATFRVDNPGAASATHLYVFGGSLGNNTGTTANDLWAFDAVAGTFTQLLLDGAVGSPPARGRAAIAWNPLTQKLMVFGGNTRGATPTLLNDTWEYDPVTNSWTNLAPAISPSPREHAAMAFDPFYGTMVLFGGNTNVSPQAPNNETWVFLGGAWVQLAPTNIPPARAQHSMVTRTDSFQDVLMCAGLDASSASPDQIRHLDVWRWSSGDWSLLSNYDVLTNTGTTFPASVVGNQAVYDPLRGRLVLQGGNGHTLPANTTYLYGTSYGGSPSNYTSEFDSFTNSWTIYSTPLTGATPFNNNDPAIGRVSRYFGGFVAATGKVYKACGQDPVRSGSRPTYNVYAYQATALATVTSNGAGCSGSAGTLALASSTLPWSSRTFQATGTGFAAGALGFGLVGLTTASTPLSQLFPLAGAGCTLLVNPDVSLLLLPSAGSVQLPLSLPASLAFVGLGLHCQVLSLELGPTSVITGLASSNSLTLTIGAL